MGWLDTTNQINALNPLNDSSPNIKIVPILGVDDGWIVSDDALPYVDNYLIHFKDWYLSLSPTNEFPKPKIKPLSRPKPAPPTAGE